MSTFHKKLESIIPLSHEMESVGDRVHRRSQDMVAQYMKRQESTCDDETMAFICRQLHIEIYSPDRYPPTPTLSTLITESMAREHQVLVLKKDHETVFVGMADPMNTQLLELLESTLGLHIEPVFCPQSILSRLLEATLSKKPKFSDETHAVAEHEHSTSHTVHHATQGAPAWRRFAGNGYTHNHGGMHGRSLKQHIHLAGKDLAEVARYAMEIKARRVEVLCSDEPRAQFLLYDKSYQRLENDQAAKLAAVIKAEMGWDGVWNTASSEYIRVLETQSGSLSLFISMVSTSQGLCARVDIPIDLSGSAHSQELGFEGEDRILLTKHAVEPQGMVLIVSTAAWWIREVLILLAAQAVHSGRSVGAYGMRPWLHFAVLEHRFQDLLHGQYDCIVSNSVHNASRIDALAAASLAGTCTVLTVPAMNAEHALRRLARVGVDMELLDNAIRYMLIGRDFRRNCPHCLQRLPVDKETAKCLPKGLQDIDYLSESPGCEHCDGTGSWGRIAVAEILQPQCTGLNIQECFSKKENEPVVYSTVLADKARELVLRGRIRARDVGSIGREAG